MVRHRATQCTIQFSFLARTSAFQGNLYSAGFKRGCAWCVLMYSARKFYVIFIHLTVIVYRIRLVPGIIWFGNQLIVWLCRIQERNNSFLVVFFLGTESIESWVVLDSNDLVFLSQKPKSKSEPISVFSIGAARRDESCSRASLTEQTFRICAWMSEIAKSLNQKRSKRERTKMTFALAPTTV